MNDKNFGKSRSCESMMSVEDSDSINDRKRRITSEDPYSNKRLKISEETNNLEQNHMQPSTPERPCSSKMFETNNTDNLERNNIQIQSFHEKLKKQNKNVKRLRKAGTGGKKK